MFHKTDFRGGPFPMGGLNVSGVPSYLDGYRDAVFITCVAEGCV